MYKKKSLNNYVNKLNAQNVDRVINLVSSQNVTDSNTFWTGPIHRETSVTTLISVGKSLGRKISMHLKIKKVSNEKD